MTDLVLNLAAPSERVAMAHHSGPGLRAILWMQGCALLCTRVCLNPQLLDARKGIHVPVALAVKCVLRTLHNYAEAEGVTILGGEPFDQAAPLAAMLAQIRKAGYSTMVYSGRRHEELVALGGPFNDLLRETDVLVDGPFIETLYDESLIWRGSSNQRVLALTSRYTDDDLAAAQAAQGRAQFISYGVAGDIIVSGVQSRAAAANARRSALGGSNAPV